MKFNPKVRTKIYYRFCNRCNNKFPRLTKYHKCCLDCMNKGNKSQVKSFLSSIRNGSHAKRGMITKL